jgi:hypothetical protein
MSETNQQSEATGRPGAPGALTRARLPAGPERAGPDSPAPQLLRQLRGRSLVVGQTQHSYAILARLSHGELASMTQLRHFWAP